MSGPAAVVRRYFAVVADLGSSPDALLDVLHPAVRITERPNAMSPRGAVRDRDAAIAGFLAGKDLLGTQTIDVQELLVTGDRVAVRATWRGGIRGGSDAPARGGSRRARRGLVGRCRRRHPRGRDVRLLRAAAVCPRRRRVTRSHRRLCVGAIDGRLPKPPAPWRAHA